MSDNVESMMYVRQVPWHGLGVNVDSEPTSEAALIYAGLDWNVEQRPLGFLDQIHKDHTVIRDVPGWFANVRDRDLAVLGVVSKQYKIIQNKEAFAFTDELIGMGGGAVKYETAGSLAGGRTVWLLAKMPQWNILGDAIDPYLVFTNSHDGKSSAKVFMSPIRVVCQNTLNLAIHGAKRMWTSSHVGDISAKIEEAREALTISDMYMKMLNAEAESLVAKRVPAQWLQMFIEQLFPIEDDYSDTRVKMAEESRALLLNIYNNRDDLSNFRGTAWGLINAVTDMVDHRPFGPTTTVTNRIYERKFERIVGGDKLVDQAYKLLKAI